MPTLLLSHSSYDTLYTPTLLQKMPPRPFNVRIVAQAIHYRVAFISIPKLHRASILTTKPTIHVRSKQFSTVRAVPVHFHVSPVTMRNLEAKTQLPELPRVELPNHRLMCRAFHRVPVSISHDCAVTLR